MDSFIPKGGVIDTVRSTRPNKSPRVTRDDGSHGNKRGQDKNDEPKDQIDIDPSHLEEKSDDSSMTASPQTSTVSLKLIRDAMIAQATKTQAPIEADPSYKKALSAYGTYASITAPPPELEKTDAEGRKTKFGKLSDLIDQGMDHVNIIRGQSYDDLIIQLWNQSSETS